MLSGIAMLLCALGAPAPAATPVAASGAQICLAAFDASGFSPEVQRATQAKIAAAIEEQGVRFGACTPAATEVSCLERPDCAQQVGAASKAGGLLAVQLLRAGPMVRVTIRFYDSQSGAKLRETTSLVPAKNFPAVAALEGDIAAGVASWRAVTGPAANEPPAPVPSAPTPPPPATASAPAPAPALAAVAPAATAAGAPPARTALIDRPLFITGAATGTGGALLLVAGAIAAGFEAIVFQQDLRRRFTTVQNGEIVVTDEQGYLAGAQTAALLWYGGGIAAAIGAAAVAVGAGLAFAAAASE